MPTARLGRLLAAALTPAILIAVMAVVLLLAGGSGSIPLEGAATTAAINLIVVVGLYTFVGTTGIISFGHIGFMAMGAYAGAILASTAFDKEVSQPTMYSFLVDLHTSTLVAIVVAGVVAALIAALIAVPLMRLRGLIASLATFPILVVTQSVIINWEQVTGGVTGFAAAPITTTTGSAVIWGAVAILVSYAFARSRIGLQLKASREDEVAAVAAGVNVALNRRIAFVVSSFLVGLAGALLALQLGVFTPDAFDLTITFVTVVMLVVGGISSLSGAVFGTLLVSAVGYGLQRLQQGGDILSAFHFSGRSGIELAGISLLALAVLLWRPRGLMGTEEIGDLLLRWRRQRSTRQDMAGDGTPAGR